MKEALKLALEALERGETKLRWEAITAIKEALAQPEQEPAAWLTEERYAQLHTAQRTWVGLTDAEVFDVWLNETPAPARVFYPKLCRSVEAKLKEKNA